MSSQDKNLPYEILTVSHFGFKYCSVLECQLLAHESHNSSQTETKITLDIIDQFKGLFCQTDEYHAISCHQKLICGIFRELSRNTTVFETKM